MNLPQELPKKLFIFYKSNRLAIKLAFVDQLTKWLLIGYLQNTPGLSFKLTSFLDIVYTWNYGISLGIFKNYYQYSNNIFIILNSVIVAYIWYLLLKCKSVLSFIGYSYIIGGAVGNLIDRFFRGAVFDFIYFHYENYGLFIFNLADAFISIGVMIIIYEQYKIKKSIEENTRRNYDRRETKY